MEMKNLLENMFSTHINTPEHCEAVNEANNKVFDSIYNLLSKDHVLKIDPILNDYFYEVEKRGFIDGFKEATRLIVESFSKLAVSNWDLFMGSTETITRLFLDHTQDPDYSSSAAVLDHKARKTIEAAVPQRLFDEIDSIICDYAFEIEKRGWTDGYKMAMALMAEALSR
ncbi:hypothetical protein [Acetivibrio clariflavus]|uniref:Uncharacterized protein n=1 Tax=Acetivibrio clariflavus (strain DSM 19732 / NBRC 101661 / EBR45) TaxID=720554 RepID=G8LUR1_ACECE|nr:hypothetical protein [Acetivibrio clariflavus]AEV67401.1 hypothetical protein Clocl_0696 [Acetivibrio clariflavus DSM 19732]